MAQLVMFVAAPSSRTKWQRNHVCVIVLIAVFLFLFSPWFRGSVCELPGTMQFLDWQGKHMAMALSIGVLCSVQCIHSCVCWKVKERYGCSRVQVVLCSTVVGVCDAEWFTKHCTTAHPSSRAKPILMARAPQLYTAPIAGFQLPAFLAAGPPESNASAAVPSQMALHMSASCASLSKLTAAASPCAKLPRKRSYEHLRAPASETILSKRSRSSTDPDECSLASQFPLLTNLRTYSCPKLVGEGVCGQAVCVPVDATGKVFHGYTTACISCKCKSDAGPPAVLRYCCYCDALSVASLVDSGMIAPCELVGGDTQC